MIRLSLAIVITSVLCSGCASYFVEQLGRTTQYKKPVGAIVWGNGDISIEERTVRESNSTSKFKILSERHYLITPDIINQHDISDKHWVFLKREYTKYPISIGNSIAIQTHTILEHPRINENQNGYSAYQCLGQIPYVINGNDVSISFESGRYDVVRSRTWSGKILHPILIVPAIGVDVILSPLYIVMESLVFGST